MLQDTDVEVTSTIGIFVKDSGLVADAAQHAGADTPLLDLARDRYRQAADSGLLTERPTITRRWLSSVADAWRPVSTGC